MSWDGKALLGLAVIWVATAALYVTVILMPAGARGWVAGAAVFAVLTFAIWAAERRGREGQTERQSEADREDGEGTHPYT